MFKKVSSVVTLMWVVFVDSLGWGIAFSVFASLLLSHQMHPISASLSMSSRYWVYESLLAVYSVCMFLCAPVIGSVADYFGRKPGLVLSTIGLGVGFILSAFACYAGILWLLFVGRIISGITAGSVSVAQAAVVDISTEKNKSFHLSVLMLTNTLGFSLGPFLGGLLSAHHILPTGTITFLIAAMMALLAVLLVIFFFKERYQAPSSVSPLAFLKDFSNIKIAFCDPALSKYLVAILLSMVAFGVFFSDVPIFISRVFHQAVGHTGMVLSVAALSFSLALVFGGKYAFSRFKKTSVVLWSQVLQWVLYALICFMFRSFLVNVVLFSLISFCVGLMYIGLITLVSDAADSAWQGRVMGVIAALSSITWGVGPLLAGWMNKMSVSATFFLVLVLITLSLIFCRRIRRVH